MVALLVLPPRFPKGFVEITFCGWLFAWSPRLAKGFRSGNPGSPPLNPVPEFIIYRKTQVIKILILHSNLTETTKLSNSY